MGKVERVAILSVHTCPLATLGGKETGGMNVYVRDLSRELSKRGVAVDVFTRSQNPTIEQINDSNLGELGRVIHIPAGPETPLSKSETYANLPQFVEGVQAFVEKDGAHYDLIHSHYWLSGWVAQQLKQSWDVPIMQMFHTLGHMKNRVAQTENEHEIAERVPTEIELVRNVDLIIAATPAERAQLMWLYKADMNRIRIIPPGVDITRFHPVPVEDARREIEIESDVGLILFVGRIEPLKGAETLLRAVSLLHNGDQSRHSEVCVVIIGGEATKEYSNENEEMSRLHDLRERLGIDEMVTFLGSRDQDRLQHYYSAAEVLVMPSHYESFGMVALEAMACGTPVIASEVGGLAYLVQNGVTGFHVPDREPEELAGRLSLLLDNPALREEMSQAALERAHQYNWPKVTDQIIEAYQSLLN